MSRHDRKILAERYGEVTGGAISAPSLLGKPVIIQMDAVPVDAESQPEYAEGTPTEQKLDHLVTLSNKLHSQINSGVEFTSDDEAKITQAIEILQSMCDESGNSDMFSTGYEDTYV